MKNLLVFSFFPAFVPPQSGGEVRLFNFYFELSKYFNITLLSSGHLNVPLETIWHTNNFVEKRVPKDSIFVDQYQRLNPYSGAGDLSGPCVAASGKYLTEMHRAYLECYPTADVIIHESPFTFDYDLFIGLDDKPRVYNSYNCEYELYKKLHAKAASHEIAELVHDVEVKLLKSADLITYCGEDDLPAFTRMLSRELRAEFIPNGMTTGTVLKRKSSGKIRRAVFIGSGHLPNVEAAEFIVKVVAPACPEVIFDIIGNCLPVGDYPVNVVRHGVVATTLKSELIASADIAINPMLSGSGSSLKILDFVAHGVPVLSTPVGMRGFEFRDGTDCLLAEAEEFSKVIRAYVKKTATLEKIGLAARDFAGEHYAWSAIASKFRGLIEGLLENRGVNQVVKPYVLALNDYDPFRNVGGGVTRLLGLYQAKAEWSDVIVLCFSSGAVLEVEEVEKGIKCIRIPKTLEHRQEEEYFNSRFHVSANDVVALRHAGRNEVLSTIYEVLRARARIVVCDHPYMVALPDRFKDRFVYSSQNFEYGLKKALFEWHPDREILLDALHHAEQLAVASSAAVVAVSAEDAKNFTQGARACAPVIVVANGAGVPVEPGSEDLLATGEKIKPHSVVFLGSAHMPNVDAANYIVESLAPNCPDVDFHLIGSVCQALPAALPTNIKVWGILSDSMKSAVLQQCRVAINPMFSGSGSNVKLADFFANGLYVLSTVFGVRGYPAAIEPHVTIADAASFARSLQEVLANPHIGDKVKCEERKKVFAEFLSMRSLATKFVDLLKDLEKPKKRMLFVTYRYTSPILGGAEAMLARLITGIGHSGEFSVDVVAPEVSAISEFWRFGSRYEFDATLCAPVGMSNVRYARFPVNECAAQDVDEKLAAAWRAQSEFEKQLYIGMQSTISISGLAWGWASPDGNGDGCSCWGFTECGLHLSEPATVRIAGFVPQASIILVRDSSGAVLLHQALDAHFELSFEANAGAVELYITTERDRVTEDKRPLALCVHQILLNESRLKLEAPSVVKPTGEDALEIYLQMESAFRLSRDRQALSLTEIRGPHSPALESFLDEYIKNYDIVVTHNSVFRPPLAAIAAAKAAGVPSILIPHAHLDDDFYHFSDVHQGAQDADLVLAAPRAACRFYEALGVKNVDYLPSGIDVSEVFSEEDERAFRSIYQEKIPFFLILGRKAGAKGYADAINEIEKLALKKKIHLVLIGPDDDGVPVTSRHATYLGMQPRSVVRGALRSCIALINMSSSESFGMVLLEAWLAGRPVIANADCSAFRDLAVHEQNALLVTKKTLGAAMARLAADKKLCDRLSVAGSTIVSQYAWETVCGEFLSACKGLVDQKGAKHD